MTVCVKVETQQSTGVQLLALDLTATDTSTCQYVMESGGSTNGWRELGNMSTDNAQVIGVTVGVVWAVAYGFKLIIRTLRSDEEKFL